MSPLLLSNNGEQSRHREGISNNMSCQIGILQFINVSFCKSTYYQPYLYKTVFNPPKDVAPNYINSQKIFSYNTKDSLF